MSSAFRHGWFIPPFPAHLRKAGSGGLELEHAPVSRPEPRSQLHQLRGSRGGPCGGGGGGSGGPSLRSAGARAEAPCCVAPPKEE